MLASRHAAERAQERHGLELGHAEATDIVMDIIDTVAGDRFAALFMERCPRRGTETWLVNLRGRRVRVAYAPLSATILTVLP